MDKEDNYKRYRDRVKYYSTETLLRNMSTDYIFIRDAYKQLQTMLEKQWIRLLILEKRYEKGHK